MDRAEVAVFKTALATTQTVGPPGIGPLRRRVASAVADTGAEDEVVAAIRVCVSEALANAVVHAYPGKPGSVEVVVEVDDELIVVTVRDEGQGFGGAPARARGDGGMGLEIIRKLTEHFKVTSDSDSGTEVSMTFAQVAASPLDRPRELST
jgi:stage II sporulation protein AB (anti-sigma F factor)